MNVEEERSEENVKRMLTDILARLRGCLFDIEKGNLPRVEARCGYEMTRRALEIAQPIAMHVREVGDTNHSIHRFVAQLLEKQDQFRELLD